MYSNYIRKWFKVILLGVVEGYIHSFISLKVLILPFTRAGQKWETLDCNERAKHLHTWQKTEIWTGKLIQELFIFIEVWTTWLEDFNNSVKAEYFVEMLLN